MGQGACGSSICSECEEEGDSPLEMLDVKDGEYGLLPYRPCATCAVMPSLAADAVLNCLLGGELSAAGAA